MLSGWQPNSGGSGAYQDRGRWVGRHSDMNLCAGLAVFASDSAERYPTLSGRRRRARVRFPGGWCIRFLELGHTVRTR